MDAAATRCTISAVQKAFNVISILHLTSYALPDNDNDNDFPKFDFVVVGGGTAGSVVSARLAEDKKTQVLLIEAGGDPPVESSVPKLMLYLKNTTSDWNYTTEPGPYSSSCVKSVARPFVQGKILGGTSGANYLHYAQGHYRDYNTWAKITNDETWRWENVLPYFIKAEKFDDVSVLCSQAAQYHGTEGPVGLMRDNRPIIQNYLEAFQDMQKPIKDDLNAVDSVGYARDVYNIQDGHRQSSAFSFLSPARHRSNLFVWKNALVTKIVIEDKTAVGVEVVKNIGDTEKTYSIRAIKEVIVSAGAINTPKLLMLSGIGPKEHLRSHGIPLIANLPVGKNLQDHTAAIVVFNMTKLHENPQIFSFSDYPAFVFRGSVSLNKSDYPDYSTWNYINFPNALLKYCSVSYDFQNSVCDDMLATSVNTQMLFSVVFGLHPRSRGKVLLRSPFYQDSPMIFTAAYLEKEDIDNQVKYVKDFIRVINSAYFQSVGAELKYPSLPKCNCKHKEDEEFWRCYILCMTTPQHHYCGTSAMGSVVDGRLRVMGVDRLRVVDASIIPIIPSSGLLGPVITIAEKAADFIKSDGDCLNF
uniref:Glucose-methanol-choline oxidoreductase N-terminal domain-containing protein n=1 Tax=Bombyx mori TaxID=7091 RepID=A0A8R2M3K7_BOMMO|nr:glucose dehydrogenase [FAD, quinone] isoform X2 [Bombyx mori]